MCLPAWLPSKNKTRPSRCVYNQTTHTHAHRSASPFKHIFVNMPDDLIRHDGTPRLPSCRPIITKINPLQLCGILCERGEGFANP